MQLLAHVEAYVEIADLRHTLILSNRFGRGENVYIAKLALELVQMIEEAVLEPIRQEKAAKLEVEYQCFRNDCWAMDHFEGDVIEWGCEQAIIEDWHTQGITKNDVTQDDLEEHLCCAHGVEWEKVHDERERAWLDHVGNLMDHDAVSGSIEESNVEKCSVTNIHRS